MLHFATLKTIIKLFWRKKTLIFVSCGVVFTIFAASPMALQLEQFTSLPLLFKQRGPIPPPTNLAIVALNTGAHQRLKLNGSPNQWPRSTMAEAITVIKEAGARLIVIDIAFKQVKTEPGDTLLEQAIKNAGNVILFTYLKREHVPLGPGLLDIQEAIPPLPRFAQHAIASGTFTLPKESQVFKTELFNHSPPRPTQPLLALQAATGVDITQKRYKQPFYINFYGPARALITWDIDEILQSTQKNNINLKNAIVYIGYLETVQTEQIDTYPTVFSSHYGVDLSGVEISATVLANLIEDNQINASSAPLRVIFTLLIFLLIFATKKLRSYLFIANLTCVICLSWWAGHYVFQQYNLWLPLTLATTAVICSGGLVFINNFFVQHQSLSLVSNALQQHMPNHAAVKLGRQIVDLEKEHQLAHGVCLVTDIKGYTALSEALPPDELHTLMNNYYAELVASVEQCGGFVGNIVGDSLLAIWSAPEIHTSLCEQALTAVKTIQARLSAHTELKRKLPTCMALHAGQFSLGHLGAKGHFEYSPVGDMINTATRIEHFDRTLGTEFLCSKPIAEKLIKTKAGASLCYLGAFNMRNKAEATELFTLDHNIDRREIFEQALKYLQTDENARSTQTFEMIAKNFNHGPSHYYLSQHKKIAP